MSSAEHGRVGQFEARHAAIVATTLRWADEAAARRDYVQAVRWIEALRDLGNGLPDEYEAKRQTWRNAIDADRRALDG